jgi:hypothetical protein
MFPFQVSKAGSSKDKFLFQWATNYETFYSLSAETNFIASNYFFHIPKYDNACLLLRTSMMQLFAFLVKCINFNGRSIYFTEM